MNLPRVFCSLAAASVVEVLVVSVEGVVLVW